MTDLKEDLRGLPALSIMQPWASLIAHGHKDIENRDWSTRFRGWMLIHAGKKVDRDAAIDVRHGIHPVSGAQADFGALSMGAPPTGGIVGVAEIVDCVEANASPWFVGRYGFVLRKARPLPFVPCRGQLGFFHPFAAEARHG